MKKWMLAVVTLALASFGFFSLNQTQAQQMQDQSMMAAGYMDYSLEAFNKAADQKRVSHRIGRFNRGASYEGDHK